MCAQKSATAALVDDKILNFKTKIGFSAAII